MDLRRMMQVYQEDGLATDLASARVCQDLVLMAIAKGPLNNDNKKIREAIQLLIFDDEGMRENDYKSIVKRVEHTFKDKQYLRRVSGSRQRWIDEDIEVIMDGILEWILHMRADGNSTE